VRQIPRTAALRQLPSQRVVRKYILPVGNGDCRGRRSDFSPGPVPGGIGPLHPRASAGKPVVTSERSTAEPMTDGSPQYTVGCQMQDGVNLGTAVQTDPERSRSSDGVEPGHTVSIDESIEECACC